MRAGHRLLVPELHAGILDIPPAEIAHLHVIRAGVGDQITLFDGRGRQAHGAIASLNERSGLVMCGRPHQVTLEPPREVTIAVGVLRGDTFSDVVRAVTELGACRVTPLITQRAVARDVSPEKLSRWRRIAVEAAKQCGRTVAPEVTAPIALSELPGDIAGVVAIPGANRTASGSVDWSGPVWLVSGPEAGFTPDEVVFLTESRGLVSVSLGPRILRAETAPIALIASITAADGH